MKRIGIILAVFAVVFAVGVYSTLGNKDSGSCHPHGKAKMDCSFDDCTHGCGKVTKSKCGDCGHKKAYKECGKKESKDCGSSCSHKKSCKKTNDCADRTKKCGKSDCGSCKKAKCSSQAKPGCKAHGSSCKSNCEAVSKKPECGSECKHKEMKKDLVCEKCEMPKADCKCAHKKIMKCTHGTEGVENCSKCKGRVNPHK